ncbi:non-homologous end-joining DNA ligase [Sphingosinicella rhizophila]|uniref:Non-homologous end-joining DNA ligase n=1 Tax=Sphingosinicella rhizophila TaxID=3050082 RepID=A0ABU3Q5N3_9SPHN|nr:non-homologous end-joining DNA ligase [Sphingosinicella sp. GR2756]MDT9598273.1 non-homologous end-joining DNA ligase [Sphingosinicella sp. GR2756]
MNERMIAGVRLTNPDKILYPEQGISKGALADYYVAVAERILPHVAFRPITMVRCPAGREKHCFYQRHAGSGIPEQLAEVTIKGFEEPYLFIQDLPGLIALVQMGVLEIHPWGARVERPDRADRIIFDLDPDEGLGFAGVIKAAREVCDRLAAIGLASFVKTTGGKGLHVVVPIVATADWREVKSFAKGLSVAMANDAPDLYLTKISKAERAGRIFIDYLRNDPTSTAVAPYSTRSRPGAPVAMPLRWEDLGPKLDPHDFTILSVPQRIARQRTDPWAGMVDMRQALPPAPRA